MNTMKNLNRAIDYLENHLEDNIDEREIAYISGYSYSMFSRIFSILSGYPLSEYIRFRKLTKSAENLRNSNERVLDIAIKYGYNSADSFTLAFKKFHNFTPTEVRNGSKYRYFSRIHFAITIQGGNQMDIKIEKKKNFVIAGIKENATKSTNFPIIWDKLVEKVPREDFVKYGSGQEYGACIDYKMDEKNRFVYLAGFEVDDLKKIKDLELDILEVPETEYAIVELKGAIPDCIHEGWKYVIGTFFPKEGYIHSGSPDFEVYGDGNPKSENYVMQLWIPVTKIE